MSTHVCPVVKLIKEVHPNAEKLSVCHIDGWTVCIRTEDWVGKDVGIYIAPDYVVDTTRPEFAWLNKPGHSPKHRVRVQKLRGVVSQGFLVPAPADAVVGDNWMERLQIERWEPEHHGLLTGGQAISGPSFIVPKYDVEDYNNRTALLTEGEEVVITEKLHGCNGRFVYADGVMYCGSRSEWKLEDTTNLWWRCLKDNPWIREFCEANPEHVLYGELLGVQGGFPYGAKGNVPFRAFEVQYKSGYLGFDEASLIATLTSDCQSTDETRWVPVLYRGRFNIAEARLNAEGKTTIPGADHIREGIVIQPVPDRFHPRYGRIKLKIVGNSYMEKS